MFISKLAQFNAARYFFNQRGNPKMIRRMATHYKSGALKPKPVTMPFGFVGVFCIVIPGLFIGAAISKHVASFLEENELFVVVDDDDDDDD